MGKLRNAGYALKAHFSGRQGRLMLLFGMEGILFQFVMSLSGAGGFGTNLYATNLGATDSQIGMIQLVGNLAALVMLLPVGVIADRTKNAKTMPVVIMLLMSVTYVLYGSIPALDSHRMTFFFLLLPLTAGVLAIYNAIWQAFFGDVTPIEARNRVYSLRNQSVFLVATVAPILCGTLLSAMPDCDSKLTVLRVFYYVCALFNLINAVILYRVPGGERTPEQLARLPKVSLSALRDVIGELAHSGRFLRYFIPVMLFYATWHLDWSMWYIGQTQYVGLNEAQLSIYSALTSVSQLVMIGFFTRMIERRGIRFPFLFPLILLVMCSALMLVSANAPEGMRAILFIVLGTLACAPQAASNLCLVQMMLDAIPVKNRSLIVSLNMMAVTLSNAVMPWLGVELYGLLGSDGRAFNVFFLIEAAARIFSLCVYVFVVLRRRES